MGIRRCVLAAGIALTAAAAVTGCGIGEGGPLSSEEQGGLTQVICAQSGAVVTDGFNSLPNSGHEVAVIDRLALHKPKGMRTIAAWIVPDSGGLYGDAVGYPPLGRDHPALKGLEWSQRQKAVGADIPPTAFGGPPRGPNVLLLVVIKTSGRVSSSEQGIDVWYHVDRRHYHLRTDVQLIVAVSRSCLK